jgi:hypothetical protein
MRTLGCIFIALCLLTAPAFSAPIVVNGDTLHVYTTDQDPDGTRNEVAIVIFNEDMGLPLRVTDEADLGKLDHKRHSDQFVGRLVQNTRFTVIDSLVEHEDYIETIAIRDSVESSAMSFMFPIDWRRGKFRTVQMSQDTVQIELTKAKVKRFLERALPRIETAKKTDKPKEYRGKVIRRVRER